MGMDDRSEMFTDFMLDNDGGMVFGKFVKSGGNDYISEMPPVVRLLGSKCRPMGKVILALSGHVRL